MNRSLKVYDLSLKVQGPVFVGSGYEIQKKEYLFLNRNKVGIVDAEKLYLLAKRRHLEADLEQFMVKNTSEDLLHWIQQNRIPTREIESCMKYVLNAGDIQTEQEKKQMEQGKKQMERGKMQIMACMADPYGNPYIPGSSIKGMLRTILLCADIIQYPEKYRTERINIKEDISTRCNRKCDRKSVLSKNIEAIENKAFHTLRKGEKVNDAVNDIMAGVIIGDSDVLERKDIILCQKWEHHIDGKEKTINLLRECIIPGTVIHAKMTIDQSICHLTPEEILKAVEIFYNRYYDVFQSKFSGIDRASDRTVFLGGGCGFVSKTMIYAMFEGREGVSIVKDIFEKTGVPRNHKHGEDVKKGVSPHVLKCTRYEGKEYMMGQCELSIS